MGGSSRWWRSASAACFRPLPAPPPRGMPERTRSRCSAAPRQGQSGTASSGGTSRRGRSVPATSHAGGPLDRPSRRDRSPPRRLSRLRPCPTKSRNRPALHLGPGNTFPIPKLPANRHHLSPPRRHHRLCMGCGPLCAQRLATIERRSCSLPGCRRRRLSEPRRRPKRRPARARPAPVPRRGTRWRRSPPAACAAG